MPQAKPNPNDSSIFFPMPRPAEVPNTPIHVVFANYMLMKLAGQVTLSKADIDYLAHDYAGFRLDYDASRESYTLKLETRPDENPRPELTNAAGK